MDWNLTVVVCGLLFLILCIGAVVLKQRVSANTSIRFHSKFSPIQSRLTINLHLGGLGLGLSCQFQQLGGETLLSRSLSRTKDGRSFALVVEFFAARSRTLCHCCGICRVCFVLFCFWPLRCRRLVRQSVDRFGVVFALSLSMNYLADG